jgi:hypothetical protein
MRTLFSLSDEEPMVCLRTILWSQTMVEIEKDLEIPVLLADLMRLLLGRGNSAGGIRFTRSAATRLLQANGIRTSFDVQQSDGRLGASRGIIVATQNAALAQILANTRWNSHWSRTLRRLDGATAGGAYRFGPFGVCKVTFIPTDRVVEALKAGVQDVATGRSMVGALLGTRPKRDGSVAVDPEKLLEVAVDGLAGRIRHVLAKADMRVDVKRSAFHAEGFKIVITDVVGGQLEREFFDVADGGIRQWQQANQDELLASILAKVGSGELVYKAAA